jgi:RND family efflux transporter MFP subunit
VGTLKPFEEVIVSSEIEGILKRITIVEGSQVSKGTLIAEINETDYTLAAKAAEAALRQAKATLANARQEYQRKESLYKEQLVTQQQFDDVAARREVAEADVDRAMSALDLAKEKLTKTKIFAPMGGGVKEKRVTAGDFVRSATPLISLIRTDTLKLSFTVIEKDVGKLKVGQDVTFRVDSFPDRIFQGRLKNIYANMEEKTRSLQADAMVSNPQNLLKPGLFARVILYTGVAEETIIVPITALLYEASSVRVYIIENDRAAEKLVKIGQKYGELMEVKGGLQGGEQLVVAGQNNLAKGVKVHVAR